MSKDFILNTAQNEQLQVTTYGLENLYSKPCLIFVHGFKGFKDWGFGPYLGEYFGKNGFFVITFNFSHNGIGDLQTEFTELDKFAQNTFSLEIGELSEVISAYLNGYFGRISNNKIGLLGHSRGGAICLLTAMQRNDVRAVAVWSSISKLDRYTEKQKEKWREHGYFDVFNTRTKQKMKLNISLLEDIEKNGANKLNLEKAIKELKRPLLIAHGDQDLSVPIKEAEQIYEWSNKDFTEFHKISSVGHTFNMKHPFEGSNAKFEELLQITKIFFINNLS
jgi:dipeptidyl aminopeptidase/acylaminoacyl peptidase